MPSSGSVKDEGVRRRDVSKETSSHHDTQQHTLPPRHKQQPTTRKDTQHTTHPNPHTIPTPAPPSALLSHTYTHTLTHTFHTLTHTLHRLRQHLVTRGWWAEHFFNVFFVGVYLLAAASYFSVAVGPPSAASVAVGPVAPAAAAAAVTVFAFHRLLAGVYVIAFVSTWVQIIGLCGENGILPIKDTMQLLKGAKSKGSFPTVFWYGTSDSFIRGVCGVGLAASLLYFLNVVPTLSLAVAWACFLSFKSVGREFFALQFDNLLLDTGLLGLLLPPLRVVPFVTVATTGFYDRSVQWLLRWLYFRLMLGSGICKLTSGDKTWRDGTALCYHYWSQPMPNWISWYADKLPWVWFQRLCCYYHFFVELVVPFGLFFPSLGLPTFLLASSLQVGILVTGNYGHFNLLSILIPFGALTDDCYPQFVRTVLTPLVSTPAATFQPLAAAEGAVAVCLVCGMLALSLVGFVQATRGRLWFHPKLAKLHKKVSPFGILNYYGLFAKMTTFRREVIIEGSDDGEQWKEYRFRYKIDDPAKRPPYVIGHLPRLDWRLWFCQFQTFSPMAADWYDDFLLKLLEASPDVLSLMEASPFGDKGPRYIRSLLYDYRFASREEHAKDGVWWVRSKRRMWWPPCTLDTNTGNMVYLARSSLLT